MTEWINMNMELPDVIAEELLAMGTEQRQAIFREILESVISGHISLAIDREIDGESSIKEARQKAYELVVQKFTEIIVREKMGDGM